MAQSARDDFSTRTRDRLAKRAGQRCSKCKALTVSASSDGPESIVGIGVAAHIEAAAPGGPRYNPNQTRAERKSIGNALWLCTNCATEIDDDESRFTVASLRQLKAEHEAFIRGQLGQAPQQIGLALWPVAALLILAVVGFAVTGHHEKVPLSPEAQRVVELVSWFQAKRGEVVEITDGVLTSRTDSRAHLDLSREILGGGPSTEDRRARLGAVLGEAMRFVDATVATDAGLRVGAPSDAWLALRAERPPSISASTLGGLSNRTLDLLGGRVTGDQIAAFREHVVEITNTDREEMLNLRLRFSFPERVVPESIHLQSAARARFEREELQSVVFASPGGSIQRTGPTNPPYGTATITVDAIAPFSTVVIGFLTIPPDEFDRMEQAHGSDCIYDYIKGVYLRGGRLEGVFRRFELDSERRLVGDYSKPTLGYLDLCVGQRFEIN